jgi:hypothetical protein
LTAGLALTQRLWIRGSTTLNKINAASSRSETCWGSETCRATPSAAPVTIPGNTVQGMPEVCRYGRLTASQYRARTSKGTAATITAVW